MMKLQQTKSNPRIVSMQDTYKTGVLSATVSEDSNEHNIALQSLNSSLSFLDELPEGKSRLAIPVIKTDRALSNGPTQKSRRDAVKKSKFAKHIPRLSSSSEIEHNSLDEVRSDKSKNNKQIGSARLGLSSAL